MMNGADKNPASQVLLEPSEPVPLVIRESLALALVAGLGGLGLIAIALLSEQERWSNFAIGGGCLLLALLSRARELRLCPGAGTYSLARRLWPRWRLVGPLSSLRLVLSASIGENYTKEISSEFRWDALAREPHGSRCRPLRLDLAEAAGLAWLLDRALRCSRLIGIPLCDEIDPAGWPELQTQLRQALDPGLGGAPAGDRGAGG